MSEDAKDGSGESIAAAIVLFFVILVFVIWTGALFSKILYRYSRSALASIAFFVCHCAFWFGGFFLGEGDGDTAVSGFGVISRDYLFGYPPFPVYFGVLSVLLVGTLIVYGKLSPETKDLIREEKQQEKLAASGGGLGTSLLTAAGASYLGYQLGRRL